MQKELRPDGYKSDFLKVRHKKGLPMKTGWLEEFIDKYTAKIYAADMKPGPHPEIHGFFSGMPNARSYNSAVLRFDPVSEDTGFPGNYTTHKTRAEALQAAVACLDDSGINTTPFDLIGIIDNIGKQ